MKPNKTLSVVILLCLFTMGICGIYGYKLGCYLMKDSFIKESAYKTIN